jgi:hypothetical protein
VRPLILSADGAFGFRLVFGCLVALLKVAAFRCIKASEEKVSMLAVGFCVLSHLNILFELKNSFLSAPLDETPWCML